VAAAEQHDCGDSTTRWTEVFVQASTLSHLSQDGPASAVCSGLSLDLVHTFRFWTGRARAQLGTYNMSGSNRPVERPRTLWPSSLALYYVQRSAIDRNSTAALFLLYRSRKRRCNRLHWVHPVTQKREEFGAFTNYLVNYEMTQTSFLKNYFRMSVSSFDEVHRRWHW
jgi:hypothetical protein